MKKRKQTVSRRSRSSAPGSRWVPVPDPKPGAEGPILVPLPGKPTPEGLAEAARLVETLEANSQIAREPGPLPAGATHRIEKDARGGKRLVRTRFSAI
ncbi:MAG: hypothetical protein DMD86_01880 [Candidatus Rokuibacteriota bacterium]|nr:MAG: hypothetical protein DMD86_01880 [Candidatus Rokubacteria bacterium]